MSETVGRHRREHNPYVILIGSGNSGIIVPRTAVLFFVNWLIGVPFKMFCVTKINVIVESDLYTFVFYPKDVLSPKPPSILQTNSQTNQQIHLFYRSCTNQE